MTVIGFEWNQEDDVVNHLNLITNKSFILSTDGYKKHEEGSPATVGSAIIPVMTSDVSPSPFVSSASGVTGTGTRAWKAFDGTTGIWRVTSTNGWLQIDLGEVKKISAFKVDNAGTSATRSPKHIALIASNTELFEGQSVTLYESESVALNEVISVNAIEGYRYYKLDVLKNIGDGTYIDVSEFQLYEIGESATPPSWKTVSPTLPTLPQFQSEGMDDLAILDRKVQTVLESPQAMTSSVLGEGKVFKGTVDLKKYFDLRKLEVK